MQFEFSMYSALLLIGFVHGIIYCGLLVERGFRKSRLSDRLLGALLLVLSLRIAQYMLGFANWYDPHDDHTTFMFYFPWHNLLLVGPLIYFYFRALSNDTFRLRRIHLWHFIPGFIFLALKATLAIRDVLVVHWIQGIEFPYF